MWRQDVGDWSQQDELVAAVIETVDHWGRQNAVIAGVKPNALPPPLVIAHPDRRVAPVAPKKKTTAVDIARFFAKHMRG